MLSPRVFHFSVDELVYECFENQVCESGISTAHYRQDEKDNFYETFIRPDIVINGNQSSQWGYGSPSSRRGKMWRHMAVQYSRPMLTFASDKLPALSGLAEQLRRQTGHRYLAGLRYETLIFDLLWRRGTAPWVGKVDMDPSLDRTSSTWRAPSWSWASVNGPVSYDPYL